MCTVWFDTLKHPGPMHLNSEQVRSVCGPVPTPGLGCTHGSSVETSNALNSYSLCRFTSLVVTSSFSDTFTISRSFSSSKDRTRSMYTANLSFRCCKSCFSCRREIRVGDRGVEAAGRTVSRLGVAVAITLFVVLLRRLVSKLEEIGIAFLLESCSVYLTAESLSVNKS